LDTSTCAYSPAYSVNNQDETRPVLAATSVISPKIPRNYCKWAVYTEEYKFQCSKDLPFLRGYRANPLVATSTLRRQ